MEENKIAHQKMVLTILNMLEYHPRKLSWSDAVTIRDPQSSIGLSIVEQIFMLNPRAHLQFMEECHADGSSLNPMDVMNVIFNCCDSLLLQQLMEKRLQCQMSIPLALPDIQAGKSTLLLLCLKNILSKLKWNNFEDKRVTSFDESLKIISFMRIGELGASKSKMLSRLWDNKYHEMFFHRDCEYGRTKRMISSGTIEASWYFSGIVNEGGSNQNICTILNLRGDATQFPEEIKLLGTVSHLCFLLIDLNSLMKKEYLKFLQSSPHMQSRVVIFYIADTLNKCKSSSGSQKECEMNFKNQKVQIANILENWNSERLLKCKEMSDKIRYLIDDHMKRMSSKTVTVADLEHSIIGTKFDTDEDDLCKCAYMRAKRLMGILLDNIDQGHHKNQLFPMQGPLMFEKLAKLRKEQHLALKSPVEVEKHMAEFEMKQRNVREQQFLILQKNHLPKFVHDFLSNLQDSDDVKTQCYFIDWMKSMLEKWEMCQKNHEHQLKVNVSNPSREQSPNMSAVNIADSIVREEQNTCGMENKFDLGLEQVFREFGQMYECVEHYLATNKMIPESLQNIMNLPAVVADLMLNGVPFELVNGNGTSVPINWVLAVFKAVEQIIGDKRIFVVSVLGAPTSGKSTLLNAMFGLKLNVTDDSNKSEKRILCSMVPVDRRDQGIHASYIMVMESEGVGTTEDHEIDTEPCSCCLGLANVTIVCIPGNIGNETRPFWAGFQLSKRSLFKPNILAVEYASQRDYLVKLNFFWNSWLAVSSSYPQLDTDFAEFTNESALLTSSKHQLIFCIPKLGEEKSQKISLCWRNSEQVSKIKACLLENSMVGTSNTVTITYLISRLSDLLQINFRGRTVHDFHSNENLELYSKFDEFVANQLWDFKQEYLKCVGVFQTNLQCRKREFHLLGNSLRNYILEELSKKHTSLMTCCKDYLATYETRNGRLPEKVTETMLSTILRSREDVHRLSQRISKHVLVSELHFNETRLVGRSECDKNIMKMIKTEAVILKQQDPMLDEYALSQQFDQKWSHLMDEFSLRRNIANSVIILKAFEEELRQQYGCSELSFEADIWRSSLYDSEKYSEWWSVIPTKSDLDVSGCNVVMGSWPFVHMISGFKDECVSSAEAEIKKFILRIQCYIQDCFETGFQKCYASRIVSMLGDFFKDCRDSKADTKFSFGRPFQLKFSIHVCKCCADEFSLYELLKYEGHRNNAVLKLFTRTLVDSPVRNCFLYFMNMNGTLRRLQNTVYSSFSPHVAVDDLVFKNPTRNINQSRMAECALRKCQVFIDQARAYTDDCFGDEFHPNQVTGIVGMLNNFFIKSDNEGENNGFTFSERFQLKFSFSVCICSANELLKTTSFNSISSQFVVDHYQKPYFCNVFRQTYMDNSEENMIAEWFLANLSSLLGIIISSNLGALIANVVLADESMHFGNKREFHSRMFIEFGVKKTFEDFLLYVDDYKKLIRTKVEEDAKAILNKNAEENKTTLEILIENEVEKHVLNIISVLAEQLKSSLVVSFDAYLSNLQDILSRKTFEVKNQYDVLFTSDMFCGNHEAFKIDFREFTQILISRMKMPKFQSDIFLFITTQNKQPDVPYTSTELISYLKFPDGTHPIDLLTEKLIGCSARCPFCRAPCRYECKHHVGGHVAFQHWPLGLTGRHWYASKELCTCTCQSASSCLEEFGFDESTLDWHDLAFLPSRSNLAKYHNWNITPDRNYRTSLYWKWFMVAFHDDLVNHFRVKPGDIPPQWMNLTWDEALDSLVN